MKSSCQQKRKVTQILKENNEQTGGMHKKSAGRICKTPLLEAAGKLKSSSVQSGQRIKCPTAVNSSCQTVLDRGKPLTETVCVDKFKLQAREFLPSAKIKLQLFPVDEMTCLRLEKDGHNPFLELTLSARKKISSVIKHLNTKWGNSREGPGELVLFPYNMKCEKAGSCRRWTLDDSSITAGELYAVLNFPAVFRLRYGWFSSLSVEASGVPNTSVAAEATPESENSMKAGNLFSVISDDYTEKLKPNTQEMRNPVYVHEAADVNVSDQRPSAVPAGNEGDDLMTHGVPTTSIVSWEDSFTSLSIGGLLSEASLLDTINKSAMKSESKLGLLPMLASDVSIGALLSETIFKDKMIDSSTKSENGAGLLTTKSFTGKSTEGLYFGASSEDMNKCLGSRTQHEIGFQGISLASGRSTGNMFSDAAFPVNTNIHNTTSSGEKSGLQPSTDSRFVQSAWDDGLTTLSIGALLSEESLLERINPKTEGTSSNSKNQISTFDSFDGIVSAHNNSRCQIPKSLLLDSSSSILDGEVTCQAFALRNLTPSGGDVDSVNTLDISEGVDKKSLTTSLPHLGEESSLGIKGIKWNDSRGPFDLGLPMVQPGSGGDSVSRFF